MRSILEAIKNVVLSYYPVRSFIEAMMKFDFRIADQRTNLMQLCFSNLAAWPLLFFIPITIWGAGHFNWSLLSIFSMDSFVIAFLTNGSEATMVSIFFLIFVLEWVLRKEYLFVITVFYFVNKSELHIHLATAVILALYFSRICYMWWLTVDVVSQTKKIWKIVSILQMVAWVIVALAALILLDYLQVNLLMNAAVGISKNQFLLVVLALYHLVSHFILSVWGHFYFKAKADPSFLPTYFSSANWILKFNMSYYLQSLLLRQSEDVLKRYTKHDEEVAELKNANASVKFPMSEVLGQETVYLKEAALRLSKI